MHYGDLYAVTVSPSEEQYGPKRILNWMKRSGGPFLYILVLYGNTGAIQYGFVGIIIVMSLQIEIAVGGSEMVEWLLNV